MKSLNKILQLKPSLIYPGHGNIIENPLEKIEYYIKHRNQREEQILDFFAQHSHKKLNAFDVVESVYKETPEKLWPAAALNVTHHMKKLHREGHLKYFKENDDDLYMHETSSKM